MTRNNLNDLREALIETEQPQEETVEAVEEKVNRQPLTVNAFEGAAQVSGPFSRKRLGAKKSSTAKQVNNERRGVAKIWDDKPVNNVGEGTHIYHTRSKE